jgi:uncharacterized protein YsxB (DUF464 family)
MIVVNWTKDKTGTINITVNGHAGTRGQGDTDVVCSATSMLVQTLLQCGQDLANEGTFELFNAKLSGGSADFKIRYKAKNSRDYEMFEKIFKTGFLLLQGSYNSMVSLRCEKVEK